MVARRTLAAGLIALLLTQVAAAGPAASVGTQRPLRIDDLFRLEQLPFWFGLETDFSPDGRAVAFVKGRPKATRRSIAGGDTSTGGLGNCDVWVQLRRGVTPINVTHGLATDSSWFRPRWSPDGRTLSVFKRGLNAPSLWLWEVSSGRLHKILEEGVVRTEWLDAHRLIVQILPDQERSLWWRANGVADTVIKAPAGWAQTQEGRESTASALDSGTVAHSPQYSSGKLLLFDATDGRSRTLAQGRLNQAWDIAPRGTAVAYATQIKEAAASAELSLSESIDEARYTLQIVDLTGQPLISQERSSADALPLSRRWSADGRSLAYLGYETSRADAPSLYRFRLDNRQVEKITLGDLDATPTNALFIPGLEWAGDDALIVLAARRTKAERASVTARRDWWLLKGGTRQCLTESMSEVPRDLIRAVDSQTFVGVAAGKIWRISANRATVEELPGIAEDKTNERVWPASYEEGGTPTIRPYDSMVIAVQHGREPQRYFTVNLRTAAARPLALPTSEAAYGAYASANGDAVFYSAGRNGSYIWRTSIDTTRPEELMVANTFLRTIAEGTFKTIEYRSLQGEALSALMILPPDYQPGRRYPLLTWVYAGDVYDPKIESSSKTQESIAVVSSLNLQIPAAQGYAILLPSMPLKVRGVTSDVLLELTNGVLPAVDKAIDVGIADPDRLFVMGHSFGGFSTYGLVGQTCRFKAAVSAAGISDWVSDYGTLEAPFRYAADAMERSAGEQTYIESGQISLGSPPWKDFGRYLRNSPIFYVDRVATPLLMIHGDLDFVPIQQAEEFFESLYRQNKRAQFVRYWGEGHLIESAANIRDMWSRIFAWFDEHGDISRDRQGVEIFDGDRVKSRQGAAALRPEDYRKLPSFFEPAGSTR